MKRINVQYAMGDGVIELLGSECPFCNGTGEPNKPA